ncbi:MAG: hypothetical protein HRT72_05605 [Flavobacteriales bacterium]|nr:hypothetical protein [Flavobacteriales bacterium]
MNNEQKKATSKEIVETKQNLAMAGWTQETGFATMLDYANQLDKSSIVPFKTGADLMMAWQYGKDIGLSFSQSTNELYPIPGPGGTRISAGVHIHEAILLNGGVTYVIVEDAVEIEYYQVGGLGVLKLSMKEVMEGVNTNEYQILKASDFGEDKKLKTEFTQTGKYLLKRIPCPLLAKGFTDRRTRIKFTRESNGMEMIIDYHMSEAVAADLLKKNNWSNYLVDMLYTRCFTRGSKRIASDLLKNLKETSAMANLAGIKIHMKQGGHAEPVLNDTGDYIEVDVEEVDNPPQ